MTPLAWRVLGGAAVALLLVSLRWLSLWPLTPQATAESGVRLSWTARPERIETCRTLSDDELAALPAHMRMRVRCEGAFARYLLDVRIDDAVALADTIRGGGLRHDRPMHVLRDLPAPPGTHQLQVSLHRLDSAAAPTPSADSTSSGTLSDRAQREAQEQLRRAAEALPPSLRLDTTLVISARRVVLVTYDERQRRFRVTASR